MKPEPSYPDRLEIKPLDHAVSGSVLVPGSKSMTNRALVLAALYPPPTVVGYEATENYEQAYTLRGVLRSEDTEVMIDSLRRLGYLVEAPLGFSSDLIWLTHPRHVQKPGTTPSPGPDSTIELFVANSGTSMRFLTAMVSVGHGRFRLDGVPRMRQRPIEDLLSALRQLGVNACSENNDGCPPILVDSKGLRGGLVRIKGNVSSQFLSAVLMVSPLADQPVTIEVDGPLVSEPYVKMTIAMMERVGLKVETKPGRFAIDHYVKTTPKDFGYLIIEPDASAASYHFAAAAITGGAVTMSGLYRSSVQGDVCFVDVLERMGCQVNHGDDDLWVRGAQLRGIDVDMNDISDTVMTLAAVACFASGPTTIRNVAHIRHKETDRLAALATELRRIGAGVDEFADGLTITPRPLHGAVIETYNDHRMAMSLALVGLKVPGIVISNPGCVAKTYPHFFADFGKL